MLTAVVGALGDQAPPGGGGRGLDRDGESASRAHAALDSAAPKLTALHRLMREDLGVPD
ncbi:hypothetical protein [Streptomyces sp. NPDC005805]|uniref:hypothetical protein n=1 Tax=Streptomyces sp. NPDC005805 TaxID=3157068 RepID=UPI0033C69280